MAETKTRIVAYHWPAGDSDWCEFVDGHRACLRIGPYSPGVSVRGKHGFLQSRKGTVTGLLPTWGGHALVLVDWQLQAGDPRLRCPWWHPDDLEVVK